MRRTSTNLIALMACVGLAGCDQFASIGVEQAPLVDSGAPPVQPPPHMADAMVIPDAMTALDAMTPEPDAATDAGPDAGACPAVSMDGPCNPVTNEFFPGALCGPFFGQSCGIDITATLTGSCIFPTDMQLLLGGACLNSGPTDSCPPTSACAADLVCRKICTCDADCEAGQCCNMPIGATGFSQCSAC